MEIKKEEMEKMTLPGGGGGSESGAVKLGAGAGLELGTTVVVAASNTDS